RLRAGGGDVVHDECRNVTVLIVIDVLAGYGGVNSVDRKIQGRAGIVQVHAQRRGAVGHIGYAGGGQEIGNIESTLRHGGRRRVIGRKNETRNEAGRSGVGASGVLPPCDGEVVARSDSGFVKNFNVVT